MHKKSNKSGGALKQSFALCGRYDIVCYGADGVVKWEEHVDNAVVNVSKNSILNTFFSGALTSGSESSKAGWAVGLITGPAGSITLANTDTHASHAGWSEFINYSESVRGNWGAPGAYAVAAASSQQLFNSTPITFTISGSGTIAGAFLAGGSLGGGATDADTKNSVNSTPLLFSTIAFTSGDQTVTATDILKVTYTISIV